MKSHHIITSVLLWAALALPTSAVAATGTWTSQTLGTKISYKSTKPTTQAKDASGKLMAVVYLENLGFEKTGRNTNADDVAWLLAQGYSVVELDYQDNAEAVAPALNKDIIAINDQLAKGSFGGISNISKSRAYVLFEGYRLQRDVAYCKDDPTVYNFPDGYTTGDSLYMDIIYPANPARAVPTMLSFSYSNSYHGNTHQRMYLPYTFSMFDDSILEGLPGIGWAWAIADHPKYCDWGKGAYTGGAAKSLGAIEVCPDAAVKARSAVRTLRHVGRKLGLADSVGVFGFSRGSTAASLLIGDKPFADWLSTDGCRPDATAEDCSVQLAVLGPGVFDYSLMSTSSQEYTRMKAYCHSDWTEQGGARAISEGAAPCMLFYNTSDDANYDTQAKHLMQLLDKRNSPYTLLRDFGSGHAVPTETADIKRVYDFISHPVTTAIESAATLNKPQPERLYNLSGQPARSGFTGIAISTQGKKYLVRN